VSIGLWLDVGSRDELEDASGVSHFIEHMVFKGTTHRNASEIASYIESVGGVLNAFTSREQTCFYAKVLDQHLPKAVEIIFDLVNNALFDKGDIEKEKRVILEEIKDVEDSPGDLVHEKFARAMFGSHPLGRSIMGTKTTVKNMDRARLMRYLRRHYRPDISVIAASGNLEHERLVELVSSYFNASSIKGARPERIRPAYRPQRKIYEKKISQTHVCLGVPAKDFNDPGRNAIMLLNSILGGGMSSRLFQQLRENLGLVYTVFSYLDFFADTSVFGIYLGTDKRNLNKALFAIAKEVERVVNEKLPRVDLDRTKEQLKGNLMLGLENTSNRMNRLAKHEFLTGRYIDLDETIASIDAVTPDEVTAIARQILVKDKFSAVAMGPVSDGVFSALE
jgi:predicted Zn-dependent peptidase